jgi:hypothetical protein
MIEKKKKTYKKIRKMERLEVGENTRLERRGTINSEFRYTEWLVSGKETDKENEKGW